MRDSGPYFTQAGAPEPAQSPDAALPPWGETRVVGKSVPRIDAYERVSGSAVYTRDIALPGMLHSAILRYPHAHAQMKKIDINIAEKMLNVRAIITGETPEAKLPWYPGNKGPVSWLSVFLGKFKILRRPLKFCEACRQQIKRK